MKEVIERERQLFLDLQSSPILHDVIVEATSKLSKTVKSKVKDKTDAKLKRKNESEQLALDRANILAQNPQFYQD